MVNMEMEEAKRRKCTVKKIKNIVAFFILVARARLWIEYDQDLLPQSLLMPAFIVLLLLLLTIYFFIVQPKNEKRFPFILSITILFVAVILTLYQHMIVAHDFGTVWNHAIVIWVISFGMPYAAGITYRIVKKILPSRE